MSGAGVPAPSATGVQPAQPKAIYAEPLFVKKLPLVGGGGRFSLLREIAVATVLGTAFGAVWKTWHWNEKRHVAQFYRDLARKEQEEEVAHRKHLDEKLQQLQEELLAA